MLALTEVAKDCAMYWKREDGYLADLIDKADRLTQNEIEKYGDKAKKELRKRIRGNIFVHCMNMFFKGDI